MEPRLKTFRFIISGGIDIKAEHIEAAQDKFADMHLDELIDIDVIEKPESILQQEPS